MHQTSIMRFFRDPKTINNRIYPILDNSYTNYQIDPSKNIVPRQLVQAPTHTLFFDGCSKGNPGIAGAGAVLYCGEVCENNEIKTLAKYLGHQTNNYAEYSALILGLTMALEEGVSRLIVKGDSMLAIKQMRGEYRVKHPNIVPLYKEACKLSKKFAHCRFEHVLREHNQRADELANQGNLRIASQT